MISAHGGIRHDSISVPTLNNNRRNAEEGGGTTKFDFRTTTATTTTYDENQNTNQIKHFAWNS